MKAPGVVGNDPIDVQVGLTVRALRRARGISQTTLGHQIGVTFQQVQKYERGMNRISASMLYRTAVVFGVQPGDLLPRTDAPPISPESKFFATVRGAEELVTGFAAIRSARHRRAVLSLVRALTSDPATADEDARHDS